MIPMIEIPKLIFASNNSHKLAEIRVALPSGFQLLSLKEAGIEAVMNEPFATLEDNATAKARQINLISGNDCMAEDSGLEVVALNGAPGVYSARYAGEPPNDDANMDKLLTNMAGVTNRQARFRTVIALLLKNTVYLFEGICEGKIALAAKGENGFGYDPIFIPDGYDSSFAELKPQEKNAISHRRKALEKMLAFLHQLPL